MFGGLKDKIGGGVLDKLGDNAIDKAVEKFAPALKEHLDKIKSLKASDINDDAKFDSLIITPMLVSVSGASGGATKLIPNFDVRFKTAMLHVRDELIIVDGNNVKLVEDAQARFPKVLIEGFKKSA